MISGQVLPHLGRWSHWMPSQHLKEQQQLITAQWPCGWLFLHSDDITVILNVKDDARVGQKTASARSHQYLASDSIDKALQQ